MNAFTQVLRKANLSFFQQRRIMRPIRNQYRTVYTKNLNSKNQYTIATKSVFTYKKKKKNNIRAIHSGGRIPQTNENSKDKKKFKKSHAKLLIISSPPDDFLREYLEESITMWKCKENHVEQINKFIKKWYVDPDVVFIRPSGNPLTPEIWSNMMISGDIYFQSSQIISFDSVRLIADGNAAVVTLTQHDEFSYKGKLNNDICKFTFILENIQGNWKIAHVHRSTGQTPDEFFHNRNNCSH